MEEGINVQKKFFQELKTKLPSNLSMANVVADELQISIDSAYRRIRGESDLSLREFDILSSKYAISTEAVLSKTHNSVSFNYRHINYNNYSFESYFDSLKEEINSFKQFGLKEMIYAALDLPVFYYFMFPKLAAFKVFFWKRNVFSFPDNHAVPFNFDLISEEDLNKANEMLRSYLKVPTIEIWSEETLNPTIRQLSFFNEIGMFENKHDILDILDDLKKVISHIQQQAELGYKFEPDNEEESKLDNEKDLNPDNEETIDPDNEEVINQDKEKLVIPDKENFKMYRNDITLSENVVLIKFQNFNVVHLGHNVLNILTTNNELFYEDTFTFVDRVMKNSTLISVSAERERKRFFNMLYHKIDALAANI